MAGPANQANNSYFVQKDLSRHFGTRYGQLKSQIPALFSKREPDQAIVYEALTGDLGSVPVFDGEVQFDDFKQSYRKSVEEIQRAYGIKVTKKFRRNDLYGIVQKKVRNLSERFFAAKESLGAGIFNGAFSTTTVADTLSLCHTAHTSDQQGGVNQGNSGTSTFSPANVEATRRLTVAFKTNRNNIQNATFMDTLLLPTALEEKGFELIKSNGKVDTALNNPNFHKGKYKMIVWNNWLTDANNWFTLNLMRFKEDASFYEWNPLEFFFAGEIDTLVSKHAGYMSNNFSVVDWMGIYGHNVS